MPDFSFSFAETEGQTVIAVHGDLDSVSHVALDDALEESVADDARVIMDLAGLTFLDSRGLGTLVALWRRLERGGGALVLAGARYNAARALWVTGLADRFTMVDDLPAALALQG
ncbi:STAS domain-containing protein [Actinocorallia longicatena]|uniref:Anti-sigma factor antagonist n=1 Tax=Actinocorallia longicatena TaxID=111803 RepID=A0ABP6Q986_9ACTN